MSINLLKFMQYTQLLNEDEHDYVDGSFVGEEETQVSIIIFDNILLVLVYFVPKCVCVCVCVCVYTFILTYSYYFLNVIIPLIITHSFIGVNPFLL